MSDYARPPDAGPDKPGRHTYADHVAAYCEVSARFTAAGMVSSRAFVLAAGQFEAARLIHAEITRRYPAETGSRAFVDFSARLWDALVACEPERTAPSGPSRPRPDARPDAPSTSPASPSAIEDLEL